MQVGYQLTPMDPHVCNQQATIVNSTWDRPPSSPSAFNNRPTAVAFLYRAR